MKKPVLALAALALGTAAFAAPAVVLVDQGSAGSSDSAATAFTAMVTVPSPSNTDLVAANAGFQVDARLNHGGGTFNLAKLTDGDVSVTYPDQLPADFPGVNTPAISVGYSLGGATNVGSVVVYAYNWNGGTPDVRGIAPFAVFTTTDGTVNAGSAWTQVIGYTAPSNIGPANLQFFQGTDPPGSWAPYAPAGHGGAIVVADDASGNLATAVTGVRVDIYCAGFGDNLRDATNTGAGVQAVSSPFLAEVDVLNLTDTQAFFTPGSAVQDWSLYR